jgi:hypothetical protein
MGYRRYLIIAIGIATVAHGFLFGEPVDQQAVGEIVSNASGVATALLALWSALSPAPAAGTAP